MDPQTPQNPNLTPTPQPVPTPVQPNEPSGARIFLGWLINWFVVPIALVVFLHFYVFQAFHVVGSSMVSTMHDSDYLIISKIDRTAAALGKFSGGSGKYIPARGKIIVFYYPKQPELVFVKRVVGLPGERVVVSDGKVRVYNHEHPDGFNPDSGYEAPSTVTLMDTDVVVPDGNVFVLGDNRTPGGSSDSRDWGFLPSENIIGNAVLRLLPIDNMRTFSSTLVNLK